MSNFSRPNIYEYPRVLRITTGGSCTQVVVLNEEQQADLTRRAMKQAFRVTEEPLDEWGQYATVEEATAWLKEFAL